MELRVKKMEIIPDECAMFDDVLKAIGNLFLDRRYPELEVVMFQFNAQLFTVKKEVI